MSAVPRAILTGMTIRLKRRLARFSTVLRGAGPLVRTAGLLVLVAGCGLISSDIGTIKFDLPAKDYTFDASAWNLPPGALPSVPCAADPTVCCRGDQHGHGHL